MSLISKIYFSPNKIESVSDLKDEGILMVDFSSRGMSHSALMPQELDFILPASFSKYSNELLLDKEESQLIQLSSNFIADCARLTYEDLHKIAEKINHFHKNTLLKHINKTGIDNLSGGVKITLGLLIGVAGVSYFQYQNMILSIFSIFLLFFVVMKSIKNQKLEQTQVVKAKDIDYIPQLQELVRVCKEAQNKGYKAFYYWSL
ncbi:hypothetical protein H7X65_01880 [Candidatus Parcubacteria bacterium]|nr:hypothetical protein [Candidatus Parcubacteria bacterium]